jgi:hypothetical protein
MNAAASLKTAQPQRKAAIGSARDDEPRPLLVGKLDEKLESD